MGILNDREFHEQALAGGASRHYQTGAVPDRGYMIGGARNARGEAFPEVKRPVDQFTLDDVRHHSRSVMEHFGPDAGIHQGAWVEDGTVVLDASERMDSRLHAMSAAKDRGERAVYDLNRGQDISTDEYGSRVRN